MAIIFDPEKNAKNVAERGLSFGLVARLAWDKAVVAEDLRKDYGEVRLLVNAPIEVQIYVAVVTPRGSDLRVISLRKANAKEIKDYAKQTIRSGGDAGR